MKTPKPSTRRRRQALLAGAAIAIAMTAMARAPQARAQAVAFQGNPTVANGSVTINRGTTDTLTVNTPQAIINWTTFDQGIGGGPIDFLPSDRSALFQNSPNIADFTILNRVVPTDQTRGISLNGTIQSRVTDFNETTRTGGNVWFFSPGGIIAGAGSVFDVGGLLLTTNDIATGNGLFGDGDQSQRGTIQFRGPANSLSAVEIQAGAQITARNQALGNAYVALVAPRVVQRGTIDVSGSAAFVAAEQADLTIGFGNLFDIAITVGTTASTAIDHSGTTTGPAGGFGSGNTVYLATVAKNSAVTMLVGGTLGYTPASSASVDNFGTVILSAGYDVATTGIVETPNNANAADITIGSGSFTSNVIAHSNNNLSVSPSGFNSINFSRDATLSGDGSISFVAGESESISVGRNLSLISRRPGVGGSVLVSAEFESGYGSNIDIGGDLLLDASAFGADDLQTGTSVGQDATGGSAILQALGGEIGVGGSVQVLAEATPGIGVLRSGSGFGGNARVAVDGEGSIVIGDGVDQLTVSASANSADRSGFFDLTANGGNGTGGLAEVALISGSLTAGDVSLAASGSGSSGGFNDGVVISDGSGGSGSGGTAQFVALSGGTADLNSLSLTSFAQAGGVSFQSTGGSATGGSTRVDADGGDIDIANFLSLDAIAFSSGGSSAGAAQGGSIALESTGGGELNAGSISLNASAFGAFGEISGGNAFGGTVDILADNGSVGVGSLFVVANANGGNGDVAGQAIGGTIEMLSTNEGEFTTLTGGSIAVGGEGGSGDQGGDGSGGIVTLLASGGTINLGEPGGQGAEFFNIRADGSGGESSDGEPTNGAGGSVEITVQDGGTLLFDFLDVETSGGFFGGEGFTTGGTGNGGDITVTVGGGLMMGESLDLESDGGGGRGGPGSPGGDGLGGFIDFNLTGGTADISSLDLSAEGEGGEGFFGDDETPATAGGNGMGGTARITASSGTLTADTIFIETLGQGGEGGVGFDINAATGGTGTGGTASFTLDGEASVAVDVLSIFSEGEGGEGGFVDYPFEGSFTVNDRAGDGGAGIGGTVLVEILSGSFLGSTIEANASADGGEGGLSEGFFTETFDVNNPDSGGAGGAGTGGTATVRVALAEMGLTSINITADGSGGDGGSGMVGGAGGNGVGGTANLIVDNITFAPSALSIGADGEGGDGEDGYVLGGGAGGDAMGGTASILSRGADAMLSLGFFGMSAEAFAGDGGDGSDNFTPQTGGAGGAGGDATAGTIAVLAELGVIAFGVGNQEGGGLFIDASAAGGFGGFGGDGSAPGASGGIGGDGGQGQGGSIRFNAEGGSITAGDLILTAIGIGGEGGQGGFGPADPGDPNATPPRPPSPAVQSGGGASGLGSGGLIAIEATDGEDAEFASTISLGFTQLVASGLDTFDGFSGEAGRITIGLDSANPESAISFNSLDVQAFGTAPTQEPGSFSFVGALDDPNGVLLFDFSLDSDAQVTLRTYSYAGGTNAAGQTIPSGGFDPILALFAANGALIGQNDDGGSNVPADPNTGAHFDTFLQQDLTTGSYQVSVTAFSNFANGPSLSDGFENDGSFNNRTNQFAFDVLGASMSSGPGGLLPSFQLSTTGPGSISVLNSATIDVGGDARFSSASLDGAAPGAFTVGGSLSVNSAGSIDIAMAGSGGIAVQGSAFLFASQSLGMAHVEQPASGDPFATLSAGDVTIGLGGSMVAQPETLIVGHNFVVIDATVDTTVGAVRTTAEPGEGLSFIDINAGGNTTVGTADSSGDLFINAGSDTSVETAIALNLIDINAGANATVGSARAGGGSGESGMFVVEANAHSFAGGTPLDSIVVEEGQTITVSSSTDDLWAAGALPRFSDGNGLTGTRLATASDDSGQAPGTQIGADFGTLTMGDLSAPFGALVGEVDGTRILLGANGQVTAPASGTLRLGNWDSNAGDNSGNISFSISTGGEPPIGSGSIRINAGSSLDVTSAIAGGEIDLNAGSSTTVGTARAGFGLDINAGSATTVETAVSRAGGIFLNAGSGLTLGTATAAGTVDANAGSGLTAGSIDAGGDIFLSAGSSITADSLTAGNNIDIFAGSDIELGDADSAGSIFLDAGNGLVAGDLVADGAIEAEAGGDLTIATALTTGLGSESGYGGEGFGNDIDIFASGSVNLGSADSAGNIAIESGGTASAGMLIARGLDDGDSELEGSIGIGAEGSINVGSADAALDIGLASLTGDVTAGSLTADSDVLVMAAQNIELGDATAPGLVYLGGPELLNVLTGGEGFGGFDDIDNPDIDGSALVGTTPLSAGGSANVTGLITAGDLIVGADGGIMLTSTNVQNSADFLSGGAILVTTDLGVGGEVSALGADIDLTSLGALTIDAAEATNGDVRISTTGDLEADDIRSVGDIFLTSTGASVILNDVTTQPENEGDGQRESRIGALAVGSPGPGDIVVRAAANIVAEDDVDARNNLTMDAGQEIEIDGLAHGALIDLESADIDIGAEGRLGRSTTTNSVRFANTASGNRTFIGGVDDDVAGYQLRADELGRVFTRGDIAVVGAGASQSGGSQAPDVVLGTMTMRGQTGTGETAGQLGNGGRFSVEAPGTIVVMGDVDFVGLGVEASVALDAAEQIRLAAETGSLSLRGSGDALAGELLLTGDMIIAGSADAIADVGGAASTDAINDRLGQSEGTASDDGFFAAQAIRVQVSDGFFVQNSGASSGATPGDRRGFTVGEGGLDISTTGTATRIVINGRQRNADGSFTTGADLVSRVQISTVESSSAQFDPRSTINGCLISGGAQCGQVVEPPPPPPMFDPAPTVRDIPDLGDPVTGDPGEGSAFPTALVTLADFETFGFEPLIDEPVTGAGNDDLWLTPEGDEEEDEEEEERCADAAGNPIPCPR